MSNITNDGITRSGTGCLILAVPLTTECVKELTHMEHRIEIHVTQQTLRRSFTLLGISV